MSAARIERVAEADGVLRLDRWFRRHYPSLSHARLERLLRTGQIRLDGRRVRASERIEPGQKLRIPPLPEALPTPAPPRVSSAEEERLRALVLYRDEDLIVIDKPAGLAVQGGSGQSLHLDALLDALRFGFEERPRLVHRLDRDTSGVLVIARTAAAAAFLARAFRDKEARKLYWALAAGVPKEDKGRIDLSLAKRPGAGRERMSPDAREGKRAITLYRVLDKAGNRASFLLLSPLTGRTHQLRVHCAALGTPILADRKYGGDKAHIAGLPAPRRLHLHARALVLPRPAGGVLRIAAPLPAELRESFAFFGFGRGERDPFADLSFLP